MSDEEKRDTGKCPVAQQTATGTGLISAQLVAHYLSKQHRLDLVAIGLEAAKKYDEYDEACGYNKRRGPRGASHQTRLANDIHVHLQTVKKWIQGEEPSDASCTKLLNYLSDCELPEKFSKQFLQRFCELIEADLKIHQSAVATFLRGIKKLDTGKYLFARQTGGEPGE